MCTAATYKTKDFYFGRTLDYEFSYGDQIVITPRNYAFNFRHVGDMKNHYAIIGMAHVAEDYPLYYDAMNEKGVAMAGLNFVGNAVYAAIKPDVENIAQFEFIPWILSQCSSLVEVRELLERINIVNTPFSEQLPLAQLHWIISDENESITVSVLIRRKENVFQILIVEDDKELSQLPLRTDAVFCAGKAGKCRIYP